jgi:hypothetical protein
MSQQSLASRAVASVALMIGFYAKHGSGENVYLVRFHYVPASR